jgi:hypothetical protein
MPDSSMVLRRLRCFAVNELLTTKLNAIFFATKEDKPGAKSEEIHPPRCPSLIRFYVLQFAA